MRVLSNLDADLNRITSLAAPVEDMDAVSKAYVEDVSQGIYEDLFAYVIATGQLSTLYDILSSGWASAQTLSGAEGWTYVSPTSFSIDGDKRDKYQKGDKIRLTQGGDWKYFYITGVSYSAPNTTITITGGSDYTLVSAAITDNYYSKAMNPQGWPISLGQRVGDKEIWHEGNGGEGSGLDADTLDGMHWNDFSVDLYYGNEIHLDDARAGGNYGMYGRAEAPSGSIGVLQVMAYTPDWVVQKWYPIDSSNSSGYQRMYHSGSTWTAWKPL